VTVERDRIHAAQRNLRRLGFPCGAADGVLGTLTKSAMLDWAMSVGRLDLTMPRLIAEVGLHAAPAPAEVPPLPWDEDDVVHGFDTSGHQKDELLDLATAAETQSFHIVKVTEDDYYHFSGAQARIGASRDVGMLVGEYHFFRPADGWRDDFNAWQAHSCYRAGDLPPMVDAEKGRRRDLGGGKFAPATNQMANDNLADLLAMGRAVADVVGVKPLCYFTSPAWGWYFRRADDGLKAQLGDVYDLVLADYVRDQKGRISPDIDLAWDFEHDDLAAMRRSGLTGRVVCWQVTGRGRVQWYANGTKDIDRCVMHRAYFDEVTE